MDVRKNIDSLIARALLEHRPPSDEFILASFITTALQAYDAAQSEIKREEKQESMADTKIERGTVKFFDEKNGFGFITRPGHDKDVFVHISALGKSGIVEPLEAGDTVEFEITTDKKGREQAKNITLIGAK